MPRFRSAVLIACAAAAIALPAPRPVSAAATGPKFTLDMLKRIAGVSGPKISPTGKAVVFTVSHPDYEEDKTFTELWAVDLPAGKPRQLTFDRKHVNEVRWSPDGSQVSFLSGDKDDRSQIWVLPFAGGEARRVTNSRTDIEHYAWRPDGSAIAYVAADTVVKRTGEARFLTSVEVGAQDIFLRTPVAPRHIWLQPIGGPAKRLTSGTWSVEFVLPPSSPPSHLSWSADGARIAFAQVPSSESGKLDSVHVAILDVASGAITPLDGAKRFQNNPSFSPDGKSLVYWQPRDGRGDAGFVNELHVAPASGGTGKSITRALDRNVFNVEWSADGRSVLTAGDDGTSVGVWMQPLDGAAKRLALGDLVVGGAFGYDIQLGRTGAIVFSASTPTHPSEIYILDDVNAKPRALTSFNAWADSVRVGASERLTWKNDDLDEDGVVTLPADFDAAKRYPVVLLIHGGPTASSKANFSTLALAMASEGWIVFQPNYRGSDNLGNRYQSAIHGDWGAGPGRDVMAGLTELRKRPYVDRARTAVTGWSYGGYMTSWLIGNYPNEWTVAMAGAPVTDWQAQYDYSDGNISLKNDMGGSPWVGDNAEFYKQQSPITYIRKAKAPTLVMAHLEDFRVPPVQAMALYRALQDNGVESKFIGFQGRTHNPTDPANGRERSRLWIEWVKQHFDKAVTQLP